MQGKHLRNHFTVRTDAVNLMGIISWKKQTDAHEKPQEKTDGNEDRNHQNARVVLP
jgi:hypothetical protein